MTKTYEEEFLETINENERIQEAVKEEMKPYAMAFKRYEIDTTYRTAPMVKYPNMVLTDRETGESVEVENVHNKEDFIQKFPSASNVMVDNIMRYEQENPIGYDVTYDYAHYAKEHFVNAFQKVTERDRESTFIFSFSADEKFIAKENPAVKAVLAMGGRMDNTEALVEINDQLFNAFMKEPKFGRQWNEISTDLGKTATKLFDKQTAELISFQNAYTGEEINILASVDDEKKGSLLVAGKITDTTARVLDTLCKEELKNVTGFSIDNFKEQWDRKIANKRTFNRDKGNLKIKSNVISNEYER